MIACGVRKPSSTGCAEPKSPPLSSFSGALERDEADDRSSDEISISVHGHLVHWPVPVKPTIVSKLIPWLMMSCPVRIPPAVGRKTTDTEQLVFGARALPHVFVWLKSPLIVMLFIGLADVPVALSVTVCGELAVPTL
jgi:hypothetical protein